MKFLCRQVTTDELTMRELTWLLLLVLYVTFLFFWLGNPEEMELQESLKLPGLGLFPRQFSPQQADLFHLFFSCLSKQLFSALSNCVIS